MSAQNNFRSKILNMKVMILFLLSIFLMCISYFVRDFLINNYNNIDFKIFSVDYVKNTGAAFSLLQTHTNLLITLSIGIIAFILYLIIANIEKLKYSDIVLYSFPIAGVFCNLIERIIDGYVTDYIRLNYIAFPVFNISDVFINLGAFLIICNILFKNEQAKQ